MAFSSGAPSTKHGPLGVGPQESQKLIRRQEHFYEERLRELGLFILEKVLGRSYCSLSVFKGDLLRKKERHFTRACSDGTKGNEYKVRR